MIGETNSTCQTRAFSSQLVVVCTLSYDVCVAGAIRRRLAICNERRYGGRGWHSSRARDQVVLPTLRSLQCSIWYYLSSLALLFHDVHAMMHYIIDCIYILAIVAQLIYTSVSKLIACLVLEHISVPGLASGQVLDSLVGVTHSPLLDPGQ